MTTEYPTTGNNSLQTEFLNTHIYLLENLDPTTDTTTYGKLKSVFNLNSRFSTNWKSGMWCICNISKFIEYQRIND